MAKPFGARFQVQVPASRAGTKLGGAGDEETLAIALSELLGQRLHSDWVQIRKRLAAGSYDITVALEDSMADVVPFVDSTGWTSITSPAFVGRDIGRSPVWLRLDQHGEAIGKTRSGKSSLIHVLLAHLTRCRDAVVWVCGAEKVYDFAAGWVDPYIGSGEPLPFDWLATGQQDTVHMLIAAMNVARWRQRQPMQSRVGWPHIVIVLDEASFALRNRVVRGVYQGQSVTAAQMAAMISQGAGSANVWLLRATQRSTNDHSGDQGGDTSANVGYSAAFRSKDWDEIGRLMGQYKLRMPQHPGQFWLDSGSGDDPISVKAPYLQEVDPSKPQLHDGATVADVAWSRRRFPRQLDAGSAGAAGEVYAARHTRMDAGMRAYLLGEPGEDVRGGGGAAGGEVAANAGYQAVMRELGELGVTSPSSPAGVSPDGGETSPAGGGVTTLVGRRPRADRVADIVTERGPIGLADIVDALRESGDHASKQAVSNALATLVSEGRVARPERDTYVGRSYIHTQPAGG